MNPVVTNHIEISSNRQGEPRAFIAGTRIRVQDIVQDYERHGLSAEQIASEYPNLSLAQVHSALAYYFENQAEIREALKADRRRAESLAKQAAQIHPTDIGSDSISS